MYTVVSLRYILTLTVVIYCHNKYKLQLINSSINNNKYIPEYYDTNINHLTRVVVLELTYYLIIILRLHASQLDKPSSWKTCQIKIRQVIYHIQL